MRRPKFTKRHFVIIARSLHDVSEKIPSITPLTEEFIRIFEKDNPNFNRDRFEKAVSQR
jgi:hypothetical protein